MREYMLTLLVAAAMTYLLTPLVRRFAIAIKALPPVRDRDVHAVPTPRLGGLAMYAGLVAAMLVASQLNFMKAVFAGNLSAPGSLSASGSLLLAGGLIVATGFVDDRWGMSATSKLAAQVAAGGILIRGGVELDWVPLPRGSVLSLSPGQSIGLTILLVVVTINAVNFIDGLDGLAAGVVGIAAFAFFIYSYELARVVGLPRQSLPALVSAVLAGMCLGFLPHNFYPARIFMGDTGSMLIGLVLAYATISSTANLDPATLPQINRFPLVLPLLIPVAILVIPYADLLLAVIRRARAGMSVFTADRGHLHHRMLNIGHSHRLSVLILYLWAALFAFTVVSLSIVGSALMVLSIATVGAMLALLLVSMPKLRSRRPAPKRGSARRAATRFPSAGARKVPQPAGTAAQPPGRMRQSAGTAAQSAHPMPQPAGPLPPPAGPVPQPTGTVPWPTARPPQTGLPPSAEPFAPLADDPRRTPGRRPRETGAGGAPHPGDRMPDHSRYGADDPAPYPPEDAAGRAGGRASRRAESGVSTGGDGVAGTSGKGLTKSL